MQFNNSAHDYFLTIAPIWRSYFAGKFGAAERDKLIAYWQHQFAHLFPSKQKPTSSRSI